MVSGEITAGEKKNKIINMELRTETTACVDFAAGFAGKGDGVGAAWSRSSHGVFKKAVSSKRAARRIQS